MSLDLPLLSSELVAQLRGVLEKTDAAALASVTQDREGVSILDASGLPIKGRHPRGGPFGAAVAMSCGDQVELLGEVRSNNVVDSGAASQHAEDQVLLADHNRALRQRLEAFKAAGREVTVWVVSSGQSCTTCHTKQEILARDLMARDLIRPGHFVTLFGASYDATYDIAGFYDAMYADAMVLRAHEPHHPGNLIHSDRVPFAAIPDEVRDIFARAETPTAVVVRKGSVYSIGVDRRDEANLYATAEVEAVRGACRRYRVEEKVFKSWDIEGELYTPSLEMGPLLFAEMGWTKIGRVHHVVMPKPLQRFGQEAMRETAGLWNAAFLRVVAGGYRDPRAALVVLRDKAFVNRGQPMWRRVVQANGAALYNGADVSAAVMAQRDLVTRFAFAACDVTDVRLHGRGAVPVLLASLGAGQKNTPA